MSKTIQTIDWLIIAEKETQAQDIAKGLFDKGNYGGSTTNGGIIGINKSSILPGTVVITRAQGHLYKYKLPADQNPKYALKSEGYVDQFGFKRDGGWKTTAELFKEYPIVLDEQNIKLETRDKNAARIASNIKQLFNKAKNIVVATDADAEGEMIFQLWYQYNFKKPLPLNQLYRVLLSSLDPVSIKHAFNNTLQCYASFHGKLGSFYQSLKPKGYARSLLDYEFGMTYYMLGNAVLKSTSNAHNLKIWGRIKNTISYHVRNAEIAHDNFKPHNSYRVDLITQEGLTIQGTKTFNTQVEASEYLSKQSFPNALTFTSNEEETQTLPPSLFSRDELIIAADKTSKQSIDWGKVLQSNYETHKILSYPRTDSRHITSAEFNALKDYYAQPIIVDLLEKRIDFVLDNADPSMNQDFEYYFERNEHKKWVDESKTIPHYALIPNFETHISDAKLKNLTPEELRLYLINLSHTGAMFLSNAIDLKTTISVPFKDTQGEMPFQSTFYTVKSQGFRVLTNQLKGNDTLPAINQTAITYKITPIPAKRPPLLTTYTLMEKLKSRGEGTSATRDKIVQEMLKAKAILIDKKTKSLRINPDILNTIDFLISRQWIDADLTAKWQHHIDNITSDNDASRFIKSVRQDISQLCDTVRPHIK